MLKLQIIIGTTRAGRNAEAVHRWILPLCNSNESFEVETLDLRDWPLPMFQETLATVGDFADPTYSDPLVKRWNTKIREADAYLFITPEYNQSLPAVLKNAIDSVFFSFGFRQKPFATVSYSIGATGGVRVVAPLNTTMLAAEAIPICAQVPIPFVDNAFTADGRATNPIVEASAKIMLDDLAWLALALRSARSAGQLPPAGLRLRAAAGRK